MRKLIGITALAFLLQSASGQLLVGYDEVASSGADQAWDVNPADGSASALWGGAVEVWGMAYDGASNTIFANDGSTLYYGPLGSGAPSNTVSITDPAGAALSMVSLAWGNGHLYGTRNVGTEAIYEIDTATGVATVMFDYDNASYDFGGLEYNADDGFFYGTNDDSTPFPRGLYKMDAFGSGAIALVAEYPAGETDIDGLAIGNGIAFLVEDEAGDTIHPFDINGGFYLADITSPMQTSEVFSGAAWVPEPSSLLLLGLSTLIVATRRR